MNSVMSLITKLSPEDVQETMSLKRLSCSILYSFLTKSLVGGIPSSLSLEVSLLFSNLACGVAEAGGRGCENDEDETEEERREG